MSLATKGPYIDATALLTHPVPQPEQGYVALFHCAGTVGTSSSSKDPAWGTPQEDNSATTPGTPTPTNEIKRKPPRKYHSEL